MRKPNCSPIWRNKQEKEVLQVTWNRSIWRHNPSDLDPENKQNKIWAIFSNNIGITICNYDIFCRKNQIVLWMFLGMNEDFQHEGEKDKIEELLKLYNLKFQLEMEIWTNLII